MKRGYQEWTFKVRGKGTFPYDMLRYDRCWPATEEDSHMMHWNAAREIRLSTASYDGNNQSAPTIGRWNSFLWRVIAD